MSLKAFNVLKLKNHNYFAWKSLMESFLKEQDLWDVITDENPQKNEQWHQKDNKARAFIVIAIDDNQIKYVYETKTAAEMWQALKNVHDKDTLLTRVQLIKEISGLKMKSNQSMEEHVDKLSSLFQKLHDLGDTQLSEQWKVKLLLSSLPKCYENVVSDFGKKPAEDLTWPIVCERLLYQQNLNRCKFNLGVPTSMFKVIQRRNELEY